MMSIVIGSHTYKVGKKERKKERKKKEKKKNKQ